MENTTDELGPMLQRRGDRGHPPHPRRTPRCL